MKVKLASTEFGDTAAGDASAFIDVKSFIVVVVVVIECFWKLPGY